MLQNLTGMHFLVILVVILLLFGAPKLPALARSLGESMNILKKEMRPGGGDTDKNEESAKDTGANESASK